MDPVTLIVVPGFLGGLVIAVIVVLRQRSGTAVTIAPRPMPLSTDVINMASIRVAGVGGLGLVAMAVAVALDVRRIGESVGLGLALGTVVAVAMILQRRRTGAMPSSGRGPANTILSIDRPSGGSGEMSRNAVPGSPTRPDAGPASAIEAVSVA